MSLSSAKRNLRRIDLNLLVILDALLTEKSISRAGQRIGLSQPATSAALSRLRHLFNDPLLIRVGRDLAPTPRAEQLIGPVSDLLSQVEHVIQPPEIFKPSSAKRTFSISASDYAVMVLISALLRILASEAPGITIQLLPRSHSARQMLQADSADIIIEPFELLQDHNFPSEYLFKDRWLCAFDEDNPYLQTSAFTLEQYLDMSHLIYTIGPYQELNLADRHIKQLGYHRKIDAAVESFLLIPFLLQGTSLTSLVLERAAQGLAASTSVYTLEPPVAVPDIHETMYWHPRHSDDPGHRWLRECIRKVAASIVADTDA